MNPFQAGWPTQIILVYGLWMKPTQLIMFGVNIIKLILNKKIKLTVY